MPNLNEYSQKVGLLGIPLGYGAGLTGSELGVNAMRLSKIRGRRLVDHIRHLGYEVTDHGDAAVVTPDESSNGGKPKHLAEMIASSQNIIESVSGILADGELPIILGGDHSIAIATFSAIASHHRNNGGEIGLIWFDAHADINTPETSLSGNIHGMPLGTILGHGQQDLINLCGYAPKLNSKYLAHVGAAMSMMARGCRSRNSA